MWEGWRSGETQLTLQAAGRTLTVWLKIGVVGDSPLGHNPCSHGCIRTCIQRYMHTDIHTYLHMYVEACLHAIPEGPSTQYIRTLVPKAIKGRVFGTRVLKCWVLGPCGYWSSWAFVGASRARNPPRSCGPCCLGSPARRPPFGADESWSKLVIRG